VADVDSDSYVDSDNDLEGLLERTLYDDVNAAILESTPQRSNKTSENDDTRTLEPSASLGSKTKEIMKEDEDVGSFGDSDNDLDTQEDIGGIPPPSSQDSRRQNLSTRKEKKKDQPVASNSKQRNESGTDAPKRKVTPNSVPPATNNKDTTSGYVSSNIHSFVDSVIFNRKSESLEDIIANIPPSDATPFVYSQAPKPSSTRKRAPTPPKVKPTSKSATDTSTTIGVKTKERVGAKKLPEKEQEPEVGHGISLKDHAPLERPSSKKLATTTEKTQQHTARIQRAPSETVEPTTNSGAVPKLTFSKSKPNSNLDHDSLDQYSPSSNGSESPSFLSHVSSLFYPSLFSFFLFSLSPQQ
jgi:hypothetical protein